MLTVPIWTLAQCSAPSEAECQRACTNVVRILAERIDGATSEGVDEMTRSTAGLLGGCVTTCQQGDSTYADCLGTAKSKKELDECTY